MSTTDQQDKETPRTTRTVVVTTRPPLIPEEDSNALCLTRRNIFDAIIAIVIVGIIIYFVVQWRRGSRLQTGLTGMFNNAGRGFGQQFNRLGTGTSGFGTGTSGFGSRTSGFGQQMNRMGNQIAGAIKKLLY